MTPYYDDGHGIVIYHGNCLDVLPRIKADVMLTDPPYGVGFRYDSFTDDDKWFRSVVLPAFVLMQYHAPLTVLCMSFRRMWEFPAPTWPLCWAKPNSMGNSGLGGASCWEAILVYGKRRIGNDLLILPLSPQSDTGDHPCPKPLRLFTWLVEQVSDRGQLICDPFMGSGTTLVAAKQLNRRAIGIELSERYCEIAAKRLAQEVLDLGFDSEGTEEKK